MGSSWELWVVARNYGQCSGLWAIAGNYGQCSGIMGSGL